MDPLEHLDRVIDHAYDAAAEPARWQGWVDDMVRQTGASGAMLFTPTVAPDSGGQWVRNNFSDEEMLEYRAHFQAHDDWVSVHVGRFGGRPGIFAGELLVPLPDLRRTLFYNDYLRRYDRVHLLAAVIGQQEGVHPQLNFCIYRSEKAEGFSRAEMKVQQLIQPHLRRAFRIQNQLSALRQLQASLEDSLDAVAHALFLVDGRARIIHMNAAARALLAQPGSFLAVRGRLSLASSSLAAKLAGLVAEATGGSLRRGGGLAVENEAGERLSVLVAPLGAERWEQALVIVANARAWSASDLDLLLTQLFGLTPAQSRVCLALLQDHSPADMAEEFQVSRHTIVTQLTQVFAKTGTSRQAELVRLLAAIPRVNVRGKP